MIETVSQDLPTLLGRDGKPAKCLVIVFGALKFFQLNSEADSIIYPTKLNRC
jgi:hypothetical protein